MYSMYDESSLENCNFKMARVFILCFLKVVSYAHQGCVYLIKNKNCKIKTVNLNLIDFKVQFILVIAKLNFLQHYSSLQCYMILQKSL